MSRRKPQPRHVNQTAAPALKLEPVICPAPLYASVSERLEYEYAVESNPRRAGEALSDWLARVAASVCHVTQFKLDVNDQ